MFDGSELSAVYGDSQWRRNVSSSRNTTNNNNNMQQAQLLLMFNTLCQNKFINNNNLPHNQLRKQKWHMFKIASGGWIQERRCLSCLCSHLLFCYLYG